VFNNYPKEPERLEIFWSSPARWKWVSCVVSTLLKPATLLLLLQLVQLQQC